MTSWNDSRPLRDDEYPEPDDDDDGLAETDPCPECGALVYEDADQCPYCSAYISHRASPWQGRSVLWIALGLLGIGALITALVLVP